MAPSNKVSVTLTRTQLQHVKKAIEVEQEAHNEWFKRPNPQLTAAMKAIETAENEHEKPEKKAEVSSDGPAGDDATGDD